MKNFAVSPAACDGSIRIAVPDGSSLRNFLGFSAALDEVVEADHYVLDFAQVHFVTPAWMVVVGDALRRFRDLRPGAKRLAENYKHGALGYAAHAGFFRYFGMQYGQEPGAVTSTEAYIGLRVLDVDAITSRASDEISHHGDVIQSEAEHLVSVLTQTDHGDVFETLSYSIREIVRNVVEHSQSLTYVFAAQFWPGSGEAEIVVSDHGIGLARSLRMNPKCEIADDEDALRLAIAPGVSSRGARRRRSADVWSNSGYGLYMTRSLCAAGGCFSLVSGSRAMIADGGGAHTLAVDKPGTTVVLRLVTSSFGDLTNRLTSFRDAASRDGARRERPSAASLASRVPRVEREK